MTYEQELIEQVNEVFKSETYDHQKVKVSVDKHDNVTVEVTRMYEYLTFNLKEMNALAKVFGTEEFNIDQWNEPGCETCDWGSQYTKTFTFKKVEKENGI